MTMQLSQEEPLSDGTKDPNTPEVVAKIDDKLKHVKPDTNAAVTELTEEIFKKKIVTKAAVRQPKGECDPAPAQEECLWNPQTSCPYPPRPATGRCWRTSSRTTSRPGLLTPARGSTGQSLLGLQ
jgi:hypothetical protein